MPKGVYERKKKETVMAEETATEPAVEPVETQPELIVPAVGSKKKTPDEAAPDGEVCADCFPVGWPDDTAAASCLHGAWTR